MTEKTYEMNEDYILEVLEDEEGKLTERILLNESLSKSIKFDFQKLLAVKNEIERINIKTALKEGYIITLSNSIFRAKSFK